ncbi:NAD(P)/FAD-dependent oxidoreductase [Yoonia sp.]|uniref:NAD(P)/FAD-dependent oxidoreductase n=1 Tax=Yoonia sp. TaxID=2212373 RepID=UPI002FD8DBDA
MIPNERPVIANSLWSATACRVPDYPAVQGDLTADVAVIGAGFTGLSAALHLAEQGVDVVVLDAQQPGWGASGRNGGQINPGFKDGPTGILKTYGAARGARMIAFAGGAADLVFDLCARHGIACDAVRPGWIRAAHSEKGLRDLHALAQDWQDRGVPFAVLDRDAIAQLSGTDSYRGGVVDPRGGSLHPLNFALGLAEAADRHGARMFGLSPVTAIRQNGAKHQVVTHGGTVTADRVLICTNAYTDGFNPRLAKSVLPVRSVQVATKPLSSNVLNSILPGGQALSDTRRLVLYFRRSPDGRFIMGGRGTYRDTSTARQIAWLRKLSVNLFPQLEGVGWDHAWGGSVAITADRYPHLHEIKPGMMAALGYNGRGVAMATAMGREIAAWATGAPASDLVLPVTEVTPLPFAFARQPLVEAEILRARLLDRLGL